MNVKWNGPLVGLALILLGTSASAQSERWLVSTTSTVPGGAATDALLDKDDACLFQVDVGQSSHTHTTRGNWFAMAGFVPGDIDGLALRGGAALAGHRSSLLFSLLSDEAGFQDGDVLGLGAGGQVEVVVAEADIALALGTPDASLDVDGFDFDAEGRLVFSLQADLSGTMLGDVERGDILRMEGPGAVSLLHSTSDVQFALDMAASLAGVGSGALGDVHGIAIVDGEVCVAVQSPSALDGAVVRVGPSPAIVTNETSMRLSGAELDALAALPSSYAVGSIALSQHTAVPGTLVHGEGHGFTPGAPVIMMMVGDPGPGLDLGVAGYGELMVDPNDGFWSAHYPLTGFPLQIADAGGSFQVDFGLPTGSAGVAWAGTSGWSFQAFDLSTLSLTAPFRVQVF